MATRGEIFNLALLHLASQDFVDGVDDFDNPLTRTLDIAYRQVLGVELTAHEHSCATSFAELGLIETPAGAPWTFAYRVPPDCILARRLLMPGASSGGKAYSQEGLPFKVYADSGGGVLMCETESACLEYTSEMYGKESLFSPAMVELLSLMVAEKAAPTVAATPDVVSLVRGLLPAARSAAREANLTAMNEGRAEVPGQLRAGGYSRVS